VKDAAGVGVELRQIKSSSRRSHHPNNMPQYTDPNYRQMKRGPLPLLPPEWKAEGYLGVGCHLVQIRVVDGPAAAIVRRVEYS
jgi:hypothetical protein